MVASKLLHVSFIVKTLPVFLFTDGTIQALPLIFCIKDNRWICYAAQTLYYNVIDTVYRKLFCISHGLYRCSNSSVRLTAIPWKSRGPCKTWKCGSNKEFVMILLIFRNLSVSSPSLSLLTITPALETESSIVCTRQAVNHWTEFHLYSSFNFETGFYWVAQVVLEFIFFICFNLESSRDHRLIQPGLGSKLLISGLGFCSEFFRLFRSLTSRKFYSTQPKQGLIA